MQIEELRKYKENSYYSIDEISERLLQLSNLEQSEEVKKDIEEALHQLKAIAQNPYNSDHNRTLYNVLMVICGFECFE